MNYDEILYRVLLSHCSQMAVIALLPKNAGLGKQISSNPVEDTVQNCLTSAQRCWSKIQLYVLHWVTFWQITRSCVSLGKFEMFWANQRFSWSSGAGDTNPKYRGAEEPKVANCWFSVLFVMACATSTSENIRMQTVYRTGTGRVKFCGTISWASEQVLCDIRVLDLTSQVGWFL